jgi:AbiV family abortive infection protein
MQGRTVSADDLLHGAGYAVEQAGRLLHDAVGLWKADRYSSAVVLAVFSREEAGRSEIYVAQRREALHGGSISIEELAKLCSDHVVKLRRGSSGTTLLWGAEQAATFQPLFGDRKSAGFRKARGRTDDLIKRMAKRDPDDTHAKRCRALYVEPSETISGWNRPSETSREDSRLLLEDVANDYAMRLDTWLGNGADDELTASVKAWAAGPVMPNPIWPDSS